MVCNVCSEMTPRQKDIYIIIDEWWKRYGFGPSVDDIMYQDNSKGRGNINRIMRQLVKLGICKGLPNKARSIRPSYLRVRNIE
jgi:SOS-response transcriptional repressor LexA